jgi:hypothetical protein
MFCRRLFLPGDDSRNAPLLTGFAIVCVQDSADANWSVWVVGRVDVGSGLVCLQEIHELLTTKREACRSTVTTSECSGIIEIDLSYGVCYLASSAGIIDNHRVAVFL